MDHDQCAGSGLERGDGDQLTMERVFYFSGYRMTVFDWDDTRLIGSQDFRPDEAGFVDFEYLLEHSAEMPARLLIDMIEEDFRREEIPHVNPFDRRALISRLIDRHYRDEVYSHARVIGRGDIGRRDDTVLLSALTNTALISPWLERLEAHEVRLSGIWSLPLLSDRLLKPIIRGGPADHVLMVSRQVRSALRNSYFNNGRLMLSRQAKFDKGMWDRNDFEGVIENLERGTVEIYNFLLNQRLLESSDHLNVYCIMHDEQLEDARELSHDRENIHYRFVSLEELIKHFGMQNCDGEGADTLFAFLCTRTNSLRDHYAAPEQKRSYYKYLTNRIVSQVTEFGTLACLTSAVLLALNSLELNQREQFLEHGRTQLIQQFTHRYGPSGEILVDSPFIRAAVEQVDTIAADADISPHGFFVPLGRVLGKPEFQFVALDGLEWEKYDPAALAQLIRVYERDLMGDSASASGQRQDFDAEISEPPPGGRRAIMRLSGEIAEVGSSYRTATGQMQRLVTALESLDEVERVFLLETTIDMRENARFSDRVGRVDEGALEEKSNRFELMIVLEQLNA